MTRNNKRNALLSAKLKMIVYKKRYKYMPIVYIYRQWIPSIPLGACLELCKYRHNFV